MCMNFESLSHVNNSDKLYEIRVTNPFEKATQYSHFKYQFH